MSTTQPIRTKEELSKLKNFYSGNTSLEARNQLLIIMGLNTALRISDLLCLRWEAVFDFHSLCPKSHVEVTEKKTGKNTIVALNAALKDGISHWYQVKQPNPSDYLFESSRGGKSIDRHQAYRIIKKAAAQCGLPDHISCHSLRKTFGYHAWKLGVPPALIMNIYNHSSYGITARYLCIEQDDKDNVFKNIQL